MTHTTTDARQVADVQYHANSGVRGRDGLLLVFLAAVPCLQRQKTLGQEGCCLEIEFQGYPKTVV